MDGDRSSALVGTFLGVAGSILVAGLLVAARGHIVNANVALVLVVVVVVAAVVGGRVAGALAALAAAAGFDFFHTQPYNSLKISNPDDVETTLLLLVVGLIVGELAVRVQRHRVRAAEGRSEIRRIHRVAELAAGGESIDDLVLAVRAELIDALHLADCEFERPPYGRQLVRMERNGAVNVSYRRFADGAFELPREGVELPVLGSGQQLARFVLTPTAGVGVPAERRVVAIALSDQLGAVLAQRRP